MSSANPSWWYDELAQLRLRKSSSGNGRSFQQFVRVSIGNDPKGWASQWSGKFAAILNEYPTIGEMYKKMRPTFRFTADPIQSMEVMPNNEVRFPIYLNPDDPVMGTFLATFLVIDSLGELLFFRCDAMEQSQFESWFHQDGPLEANIQSAGQEVSYLFSHAVLGPDTTIDQLEKMNPTFFLKRWNWVRDTIVVPNL